MTTLKVSRNLVVALINADDSGLSVVDKQCLQDFAEYVGTGTINIKSEYTSMERCRFSRLFDDCLYIEVVHFEESH